MSAESLRPVICRNPVSSLETCVKLTMATMCLSAVFQPLTTRHFLSSGFFGFFGSNVYFALRCNLFCLSSSGESPLKPTVASPISAFFATSTAAMLARPALLPSQVVAVTALTTVAAYLGGLAEEEQLAEENKQYNSSMIVPRR